MKTRVGFAALLALALVVSGLISIPPLIAALSTTAMRHANAVVLATVVAGLLLQLVGHLVRSEKHALLLRQIRPIGRPQVFRGQMIGFMFNALLPLRVGELMRAHYIGRAVEISRSAVFSTIVFERCVDLLVVSTVGPAVMLVAAASGTLPVALPLVLVPSAILFVLSALLLGVCYRQPRWFLVLVFHVTGLLNERLQNRSRHIAWSFCHALRYALPDRRVLTRYLVLSIVMWLAYLGSLAVIAGSLRGWAKDFAGLAGSAVAPYLGVTSWRGMGVFPVYAERTANVAAWAPVDDRLIFVTATWLVLVVPSVALGIAGLLHRQLVHHVDGNAVGPVVANKLFRDTSTSTEFAHILTAHFRGEQIGRIVSREESLGNFTVVKALKGGSHASTLLVLQDDRLIVKKITLPEHGSKLVSQYEWLRARETHPEIVNAVDVDRSRDFVSIDIEFRAGYLSFFEHLHATAPSDAWRLLERMLCFVDSAVHTVQPVQNREATLDAYITTKALGKVHDAAEGSADITRLLAYTEISVNGETMRNFPQVIEAIRELPAAIDDLLEFSDGIIHGDLTIDNLMVEPTGGRFMIIDPNDENAIADPVVDYAKLLQSLHSGYEFLLMHDVASVDQNRITFEERKSAHYEYLYTRCMERFAATLDERRYRSLLFHEAMHYCRMLTYRVAANPASAAMYYGIAVRLLNHFLDQYEGTVGERDTARVGAARDLETV